jgi:hypothetical protein
MLFAIVGSYAQESEKEKVKLTIDTFFEGLHKGDTAIIAKSINKDLKLQTTGVNQEGKTMLRTQSKSNFLNGVAGKNPEDKWFEKLLSYDIKIDGTLASVWTPYEFYRNDEFSHCGTNSFQLYKNNGHWEIVYLIDTRKRSGCK